MNLFDVVEAAKSDTHLPAQHVLVYGEAKTGKTELLGSLAEKYKILWVDLENGWRSLLKLPPEQQKNIELVRIPDTREFPVASTSVLELSKGRAVKLCVAHGGANCPVCRTSIVKPAPAWQEINWSSYDPAEWVIVLDSITQFANSIMANLCRNKPDDFRPGWDEYGPQGLLLDRFFSSIQQAPYNFVCSALVLMSEQEDKSKKLMPLCGTTNYSANVAKYFDHIVFCEMKGKKHAFGSKTTYSINALTGSRTDVEIESQDTAGDKRASLLPFFDAARYQAASQATPTTNQTSTKTLLNAAALAKNL